MIAGMILSGILIGALAGFVGLISGLPVWTALLIYSVFGALCILVGTAILAIKGSAKPSADHALPLAQPDR